MRALRIIWKRPRSCVVNETHEFLDAHQLSPQQQRSPTVTAAAATAAAPVVDVVLIDRTEVRRDAFLQSQESVRVRADIIGRARINM